MCVFGYTGYTGWIRQVCVGSDRCLTPLVVLAVGAERFRGDVAAQPPPAALADAVPDVVVQDTPPVVVTESGTAVCQHRPR